MVTIEDKASKPNEPSATLQTRTQRIRGVVLMVLTVFSLMDSKCVFATLQYPVIGGDFGVHVRLATILASFYDSS